MENFLAVVGVISCVVVVALAITRQQSEHRAALSRLEFKVDLLLAKAGMQPADDLTRVRAALEAGEKIRAVKLYREVAGVELIAAKQAVDQLDRGEAPSSLHWQ